MSSDVGLHVLYRIANTPVRMFPFPHIYVDDVFPQDYYEQIRNHLPPREALSTLLALGRVEKGYSESRLVLPLTGGGMEGITEPAREFWRELAGWMLGSSFGQAMLGKFENAIRQRIGNLADAEFRAEALLVQDYTTYSLGPHTDSPIKVMSFLFYLPADASRPHLGTSIYVPRDPAFTCVGGPHYPFESFQKVCTMPYVPNTLFAFPKLANSFHGVEPVRESAVRRDLLLYDIKIMNPPEMAPPAASARPVP